MRTTTFHTFAIGRLVIQWAVSACGFGTEGKVIRSVATTEIKTKYKNFSIHGLYVKNLFLGVGVAPAQLQAAGV